MYYEKAVCTHLQDKRTCGEDKEKEEEGEDFRTGQAQSIGCAKLGSWKLGNGASTPAGR